MISLRLVASISSSQAGEDCAQDGVEGELLARQLGTQSGNRCTDPGADERLESASFDAK